MALQAAVPSLSAQFAGFSRRYGTPSAHQVEDEGGERQDDEDENSILAITTVPAAMWPKPKTAATNGMTKNRWRS